MAPGQRHAAGRNDRRFAVQVLDGHAPPRGLADGLPDFFAAVDVAVEWLDREDPLRIGQARLAIVETRADGAEQEVWTYPPSRQRSAGQELVELFGFNPAAWQPRVEEYSADRHRQPRRVAS